MRKFLFCLSFWILAQGVQAHAQEFFGDLLSPNAPATSLRASAEDAGPMSQQKVNISVPLTSDVQNQFSLNSKWGQLNLETDPSHLYDAEFGFGYRHLENQNEFWGLTSSIGSAGDQIFHSRTKTVWNVTGFYSTTRDPSSRWIWLVNDSNNRSFLNEIPLPGFAYLYRPSNDFLGVFGFPFVFIRWKMNELWTSQFFLLPYIYRAEFSRKITEPLSLYISAERNVQSYYRENRQKDQDRLFYSETRLVMGLKSPLSRFATAEIFGGFLFNRALGEDENFKEGLSNSTSLDNHRVVGAQLQARF